MKHFRFILCLFAVVALGACTSEPAVDEIDVEPTEEFTPVVAGVPVQGDVDFITLHRYQGAIEDATYTTSERKLYRKDGLTGGIWELDTFIYYGGGNPLPSSLVIRGGKVWKPVELFHSAFGASAFATAISAVNVKLNKEYQAYARRPFDIDTEKYTLSVDGVEFNILEAKAETLVLSCESRYEGGRTHEGGYFLYCSSYTKSAPLNFDADKELGFESVIEAYDWLINIFRDTFGEKVDRNELYAPNIIYEQPYFYLSTLQAERDRIAQGEQ